jgi:hypothetical protein
MMAATFVFCDFARHPATWFHPVTQMTRIR